MVEAQVFSNALGIEKPWFVSDVKLDIALRGVDIYLERTSELLPCPMCGKPCPDYDSSEREWRHLDFFQYEAHIHAKIPRINCPDHGVKTVEMTWTRKGSGFTKLFEFLAIQLSKEMPVLSAAEILRITDDSLWRILRYYVDEARKIMDLSGIEVVGDDEIAVEKGHRYETVFYDTRQSRVIHTEIGKRNTVFRKLKKRLPEPEKVKVFSMDMAKPYILGASKYFPEAGIVFDHFHIVKDMNDVVDRVRRREQKGNDSLKKSRYLWQKNTENLTKKQKRKLHSIKKLDLITSRAYHFKLALQRLWEIPVDMARKYLEKWITWAFRSGIPEIVKYGKTMKNKFDGIIRGIVMRANNAMAEGINNKIKTAFKRSYGFKSPEYRDTMIFLIAGRLDLPRLFPEKQP